MFPTREEARENVELLYGIIEQMSDVEKFVIWEAIENIRYRRAVDDPITNPVGRALIYVWKLHYEPYYGRPYLDRAQETIRKMLRAKYRDQPLYSGGLQWQDSTGYIRQYSFPPFFLRDMREV